MMVMVIAAGLSLIVVSTAISQNRSSGVDRQRTVAVAAAEGGVDATYAAIQSSGLNLPCRWPAAGTASMKAYPDPTQVVATIDYYTTAGGARLPCAAGVLAAGSLPTSALITSTATTPTLVGTSNKGVRTMQANVNLMAIRGGGLGHAIFGETTIFASNNVDINGSSGAGSNANLYTNGNFSCNNNQIYHGSVIAPSGSITMDGACSVDVDAWARNNVSHGGNGVVGGRVISSSGAVTLSGNTTVNGTVLAAGAINWSKCTVSKCFANQASAAPPAPHEDFPILRGDATTLQAWTDAGYTVVYDNNCAGGAAGFGDRIKLIYAPLVGKTLVRTTCSVQFKGTGAVKFAGDFALFASGAEGISSSNLVSLESTGPVRSVYLVVPYDAAVRPCTAPGITTDNQFSSGADIKLLVYTPCNVNYSNNGGSQGQVYGGNTVQINNQFTFTFAQMPVFGIDPISVPPLSYTLDILYKREVRNP